MAAIAIAVLAIGYLAISLMPSGRLSATEVKTESAIHTLEAIASAQNRFQTKDPQHRFALTLGELRQGLEIHPRSILAQLKTNTLYGYRFEVHEQSGGSWYATATPLQIGNADLPALAFCPKRGFLKAATPAPAELSAWQSMN